MPRKTKEGSGDKSIRIDGYLARSVMSIRIDCLFDLNFDLEQKRNEIPSALKFQIGREQTGQRIHPCEFHPLFSLSRSISLFFPLGRWFSVAGAHEASRSLPFLGYRASEDDTLRLVKLGRSCVYFERKSSCVYFCPNIHTGVERHCFCFFSVSFSPRPASRGLI